MRKVLVIGATGFLGYHLLRELTERGIAVYALCRGNSTKLERIQAIKNVTIISCGLEELDKLPELCQERGFDVLYHLAWRGALGAERADSVIQAENITWNLMVAKAADVMGVKKLVVTGTVCENQCETIIEQQYTGKSAYYLLAKRAAYELLSIECKRMGLPLVWCTFYHPIGRYSKPEQIIMNTIIKLKNGEAPKFGPANKWFDVIAVEDLCHGLYLAGVNELKKDRYFIGSGQPRLLRDYLYEIRDIVNPNVELQIGYYPDDGLPMKKEWLDVSEFSKETGFESKHTIASTIICMYEDFVYLCKA